ncbi:hypothetical protein LGL55_17140 [Clostridium tagluense]|uniref:hypothetical protein n=1 Tax=Clostridium tagluense TaxID=360422 RepID=UPI001C0D043A|nr:hypothetical protein [Clostridium tagluense]MBU3130139.1 hypothetical protein [Clostridium tagluense]MCB2299326.1 hypothetical protein [Clostridium tagluense]MCB2313000.1 hypothetical protein [Clostridium tagluense]MCB2317762.1 hypothetical protein [Clostridium tagluense]MCB2322549.1 hypothetical protein [Clostridium tagluense]
MAKFGYLFLNKGNFNDKQIISEQWINESTAPRYKTYENIGHYIIIVPELNMVVVFTSRIYNNSLRPMHYFKNYIVESIEM